MGVLISFQNVDKAFGSNLVFKGLNLEIQQGETLTVLGGSGTGKSVLLKMLLGLLPPDRGSIFFNNIDIAQCKKKPLIEIRRRMGMLFQGAALFDSLNVFENIAYPLREHFDYSEEKISSIVQEKLEMVGLPGTEKVMPADLSGGRSEKQTS